MIVNIVAAAGVICLLAGTGCTTCSAPFDNDYAFQGGIVTRPNPCRGRIGSVLDPDSPQYGLVGADVGTDAPATSNAAADDREQAEDPDEDTEPREERRRDQRKELDEEAMSDEAAADSSDSMSGPSSDADADMDFDKDTMPSEDADLFPNDGK